MYVLSCLRFELGQCYIKTLFSFVGKHNLILQNIVFEIQKVVCIAQIECCCIEIERKKLDKLLHFFHFGQCWFWLTIGKNQTIQTKIFVVNFNIAKVATIGKIGIPILIRIGGPATIATVFSLLGGFWRLSLPHGNVCKLRKMSNGV